MKYVIITNNHKINGVEVGDFKTEFQKFTDWKTQTGMPAKVITVDEIRDNYSGVDIQEKIREFIKVAYNLWGTEYILLGGAASIIPVRYLNSDSWGQDLYTDLYYAAIDNGTSNDNWNADGDTIFGESTDECEFTADIAIGRAPVDTLEEVQLFLKKNFTYTRCSKASDYGATIPSGNWLNTQLNICGPIEDDYPWYIDTGATEVENYGENGMLPSWFIAANYSENSGVNSNQCNEQYTMHYYWNPNSHNDIPWYDDTVAQTWCPAYFSTDTNSDVYDPNGCDDDAPGIPIIDAYITHDDVITQINNRYGIVYHMDHAGPWGMGLTKGIQGLRGVDFKNLSNSQDKYPVFIAGGCYTTPIAMDFYIGEQWVNAVNGGVSFVGNSIDVTTQTGVTHGVEFFKSLYEFNKHLIGYTNIFSAIINYDSTELRQLNHLLGDPALSIYTDKPNDQDPLSCNAPTLTNGNNNNYTINSISGIPTGEEATLTLYKESEVLASAVIDDVTTSHTFNITPDTVGDMKVTMTCHNTTPYEEEINITQKNGVHLYISNVEINDNNNGIIEPGEEIILKLTLKNTGDSTANASNAILSTTDATTSIELPILANYASINSDGTVDIEFSFFAGTENKIIPFSLSIDGGTFVEEFFLDIIHPQLELGDRMAFRNGNEVNDFMHSQVYNLFIRVNNFGKVGTNVINSVLTTTSGDIQINTNSFEYGYIAGLEDEVNTTPFTFQTKSTYTDNSSIPLKLKLEDSYGNIKEITFDLKNEIPLKVSDFDFSSSTNHILLKWVLPIGMESLDINGYNIYRDTDISGSFEEKINNNIISGTPLFYDDDVSEESEYFYKISVVSNTGDEERKEDLIIFKAWTTIERSTGFPVKADVQAALVATSSPTVFDVNGDGNKEIFLNYRNSFGPIRGRIMGFKYTGEELFDIDGTDEIWGFADVPQEMGSKPAIGDVNNDGDSEVFSAGLQGHYYAFKTKDEVGDPLWADGHILTGNYIFKNPVLADINNDGFLNSIIANHNQKIVVYDNNSKQILWSTQIAGSDPSSGEMAVADLNGDNLKDIVIGFRDIDTGSNLKGAVYVFWNTSTASQVSFSPSLIKEFPNEQGDGTIVLADINNDGKVDILTTTKEGSFKSHFYVLDYNGDILDGNPNWNDFVDYGVNLKISVGDLNNDNQLEIVLSSTSGLKSLVLLNNQGNTVFYKNKISQNPAILADIDNDPDDIEIIINYKGVLYAYKPDVYGTECENWRLQSDNGSKFVGSPFIGDIDNDGKNEVVISTEECETYVWETEGVANKIAWGSQRYDAQNTGAIIPPCMVTGNPVEVSTSTWNNVSNYYEGDLVINENVVLTVNSGTLSFAQGSKLVIKKGGKLLLGNGTQSVILNSECGTYWQGIRVEGDASISQNPESNQGVLKINANVTIQDAEIAIYVGGEEAKMNKGDDLSGDETWNVEAGGIIKIDGANFINNISGIEFPSYRDDNNDNASYIKNTTFKTTTNYKHLENPDAFVTLWGINKITIEGNIFRNETLIQNYPNSNVDKAGKGIVTTDADLIIKPNPDDVNSYNHFENLRYAIFAQGTGSLNDIEIKENTFISNYNNIRIENIDNVQIVDNDIEVFLSTGVYFPSIYLKNSDDFIFEENNIHGPTTYNLQAIDESGANSGPYGMGVWLDNCHATNELYKNNFTQLFNAIIITDIETKEYDSASSIVSNGLKIICNTFDDVKSDIYIEPASFINTTQGSSTKDAGNTFSSETYGGFEIFSRDKQLTYYHRNNSLYIPQDTYHVSKVNDAVINSCSSKIDRKVKEEDISNKEAEINQDRLNLLAITDGGDTESLNETVDEAENNEALSLRNELLSKSPSLSDTVMVNTTAIEDVLPSLMVKQVLAANPKAAKSEKVQSALDSRQNQLPEYMRAEIDLGKNIVSYKERLESILSQDLYEHEYLVNKRISQLKKEGSTSSLDSLETMLNNQANTKLNRAYQLINFYLSRGNLVQAQSVFTTIPTSFALSSKQQTKYDKLNQLYSIRFNLENANKSWFEMTSSQKGVIVNLAIDSTSTAGMQARTVLSLVDHIDYNLYMPIIDTSINQTNSYNEPPEMLFKAYPEVATDYFIIEYVLGENENPEEVTIAVFDDKGNQLKSFEVINHANQFLIECENWKEGVYWCRKSVGKRVTEQEKVIINKNGVVIDSVTANSVKGTNSLVLFPNPTSGYLFVSFNLSSDTMAQSHLITITNTKGTLIAEYKLKNNLTQIATDKWQQGVYIVNIIANNKIVDTAKIIVE